MRTILLALALIAAAPAMAQTRAHPEANILRNAPTGTEEEAPAVAPPVNLRPTQLLRCPGKRGITLQYTPCRPATAPPGVAAPASAPEVIDLSQLEARPQAETRAPRVEDPAANRWAKGALYGAGKLALLLAAIYAFYRLGRYARDRFQERFGQPEMPSRVPRRIR